MIKSRNLSNTFSREVNGKEREISMQYNDSTLSQSRTELENALVPFPDRERVVTKTPFELRVRRMAPNPQ